MDRFFTSTTPFQRKCATCIAVVAGGSAVLGPGKFAQIGWEKLGNLAKITGFFTSLHTPFPAFNAHFIFALELAGGSLLIVSLASCLTGFLLAGNMFVAYWTGDHDPLVPAFPDPGKPYVATFLFASIMVFIFGAGFFSLDALIPGYSKEKISFS